MWIFCLYGDDVVDTIAKVDEDADHQEFESFLADYMVEEVPLMGPIEDEYHGLFEVYLCVELFVELVQLVDQISAIKHARISMQSKVSL